MITKENFKDLLNILGFENKDSNNTPPPSNPKSIKSHLYTKFFKAHNCTLSVDFKAQKLIYPPQIRKDSNTTSNFSQNESFVVFECVNRLLEQGYNPAHLHLEKTWILGHSGKSGRADITIYDEKNENVLLIIECKTAGSEFAKAKKELFSDESGKQLFSYATQARSVKWLSLYSSDFDTESSHIKIYEETLKIHDDENILILAGKDDSILTFQNASQAQDLFRVWEETYNKKTYQNLIFSTDSKPYKIGVAPLKKRDLKRFSKDDGLNLAFKEILRHNNISDKENAFNKLLSLFICKLVDEKTTDENDIVKFQYKEGTDTYFTLYSRLLELFHQGMDEFLKEDVYNINESEYIPRTLKAFIGKKRKELQEELEKEFRNTKLLSSQFFAFREVYNEKLFLQNGKILVEMVELLQPYKLSYATKEQFLSDLFEQLIRDGFKQDEGQYFTPIPITRFVWNALPYENFIDTNAHKFPKVIDFACGAGHFLTEGIAAIKDYISDENISDEDISGFFYGVDKDNRLAKLSKVAMLLNGASNAHIMAIDGLEHDDLFYNETLGGKSQSEFYKSPNAFDILVANPPYSVEAFKSHLKRKVLKEFKLLEFLSFNSSNIENIFVERITQILKPSGIAAIVLPSSILSNADIATIKTRELLLKHFHIRAIASFGNKTFGATGTNTAILFLERFSEPPQASKLVKDSVEAILNNEDLQEWQDKQILESYLATQGIEPSIYSDFLSNENFDMSSSNYFENYKKAFEDLSETKKKKDSPSFKKLPQSQQNAELRAKCKEFILSIEREKLLFFALTFQSQTLIIKSPEDTDAQKKFLGFFISNAKTSKAGLSELENSLLSDRFDRQATNKLSFFIKQAFKEQICHNDELDSFCVYAKTSDLLRFDLVHFNKAISLNPTSSGENVALRAFENSKYKLVALKDSLKSEGKGRRPAAFADKNGTIPFIKSSKILEKCNEADFDFEALIIGDGGGANVHYMNEKFSSSDHTYIFSANDKSVNLKFVYYLLNSHLEILEAGFKGIALKNISKTFIQNIKIPLPPIDIQREIVSECEKVEASQKAISQAIDLLNALIATVLSKCGIIQDSHSQTDQNRDFADILSDLNTLKITPSLQGNTEAIHNKTRHTERSEVSIKKDTSGIRPQYDTHPLTPSAREGEMDCHADKSARNDLDFSDLAPLLNALTPIFESIATNQTIYRLNDKKLFSLQIGKRVLDSELNANGKIPVYSANVLKPFGFIDKEILKNYDKNSVLWGIDGDWLVGFIPKNRPFYPTDHCGVLRVDESKNNAKYLSFILQNEGAKAGFSRNLRASIERVGNLKIKLPPRESQEKIVLAIENIESKIALLNESLKTLENRQNQILKHFLGI